MYYLKIRYLGTGEMTQWLIVYTTLAQGSIFVLSTQSVWLITYFSSNSSWVRASKATCAQYV